MTQAGRFTGTWSAVAQGGCTHNAVSICHMHSQSIGSHLPDRGQNSVPIHGCGYNRSHGAYGPWMRLGGLYSFLGELNGVLCTIQDSGTIVWGRALYK